MRDAGKLVGGAVIVLVVVAGPLWMRAARGVKSVSLAKAVGGERCLESREEMRKKHPALLASWRERAVRFGDRTHPPTGVSSAGGDRGGPDARISLTGTCLGCHGQASEFCDKCHVQAAVSLSCWQCHEASVLGRR